MNNARLDRRVAAEFIGTFGIVLAGAGAIVIDESRQGVITHVGVAATFGLSQRSEQPEFPQRNICAGTAR